jgi:glutathione synthase/RimK-type ligase-like ATP-grasp enzyme
MSTKLYAYRPGSRGARALANELGIRILRHEGSRYAPRSGDIIINWGSSDLPDRLLSSDARILNPPGPVKTCTNKLQFFQALAGNYSLPPWGTDIFWARDQIRNGYAVCCRTMLTGHSAQGLVLVTDEADLVDAQLYTRYIKKREEYRIHVMRGEIIDRQRKARRTDHDSPDWQVRTHANGFVYAREDCHPDPTVDTAALEAVESVGLDFGAVDVIWNADSRLPYVLEVNTAPGLEGSSPGIYATNLRRLFNV